MKKSQEHKVKLWSHKYTIIILSFVLMWGLVGYVGYALYRGCIMEPDRILILNETRIIDNNKNLILDINPPVRRTQRYVLITISSENNLCEKQYVKKRFNVELICASGQKYSQTEEISCRYTSSEQLIRFLFKDDVIPKEEQIIKIILSSNTIVEANKIEWQSYYPCK